MTGLEWVLVAIIAIALLVAAVGGVEAALCCNRLAEEMTALHHAMERVAVALEKKKG